MRSSDDDLVVEVRFEIQKDADGYPASRVAEALLCKPLDAECSRCIVVSVPFYLRDVAYGDTISTIERPPNCLRFNDIVTRGGYSVYRVFLHDLSKRDELVSRLLELDALLEQDGELIAVAVPSTANRDAIVEYLIEGNRADYWGAQDGYVVEKS